MLNVLLTKFSYFVAAKSVFFMIGWFLTINASKLGHFEQKKVLGCKEYFEVLFGKSGAYKSKYTIKPLLSQNMVHFTPITK